MRPRTSARLALLVASAPALASAGTVTGTVSWSEARSFAPVPASHDPHVCGVKAPLHRRHVAVRGGGVEGAVVTTREAAAKLPASEVTVELAGCQFSPRVLVLGVGSAVRFHSQDPVLHNVTVIAPDGGALASYNLVTAEQATPPIRLATEGRYRVRSRAGHHWMNAHIWVRAHGPVAASGPGGRFTLEGAGELPLTLVAWHPDLGIVERRLEPSDTSTAGPRLEF